MVIKITVTPLETSLLSLDHEVITIAVKKRLFNAFLWNKK